MGLLDRIKKAVSSGGGVVGTSPSEQFPTTLDLVHAALSRFESSRARAGGWVSVWIRDPRGKELGVIQYSGDGILNLCSPDDIDLAALFRSSGREDLALRCDERSSAMFAIQDATLEEVALAIDLVVTGAFEPPKDIVVMAEIDPG